MDIDNHNTEDILNKLKELITEEEYDILKERIFTGESSFFPEDTKLIACPHEIVFTINANVLEENEEGETIGSKELCVRTYHIPIPDHKDYKEYMNAFFGFFEQTLLDSIDTANQTTNKDNPNNG